MNLFKELQNKHRYQDFFVRLKEKLAEDPYRNHRTPSGSEISPQWLLLNQDLVIKKITKGIKNKNYEPVPAKIVQIRLDKERNIFSLSWPDKILDSVFSSLLTEVLEPNLSDRLFSFRKGRGNTHAISQLSEFISQSTENHKNLFVIKQDISNYGESINRTILKEKFFKLVGKQDDYIFKLLNNFLHPKLQNGIDDIIHSNGIPTGFSITPVCENLYLSDLDKILDKKNDLFYSRFGDDIIIAANDQKSILSADSLISNYLSEHKLSVKPEKRISVCLNLCNHPNLEDFKLKRKVEYLGFSINKNGGIFLSEEKLSTLKKDFRATAKKAALANLKLPTEVKLRKIISSITIHLEHELRHPYLEKALRILTDSVELKKLDTWIAKVCLRYVYKTGHDRVFKYKSLHQIREMGLPSIIHLKNSLRRKKDA